MEKLIVSTSPHLNTGVTTKSIMRDVVISLLPATVAACVLFGLKALFIVLACTASAVLSEMLFNLITRKKFGIDEPSSVVTGLLLALNLPASTEIWQCVVGSVFAIIVVKCLFGGLGCNFANPAITARVFMLLCFASVGGTVHTVFEKADIVAGATPLAVIGGAEGKLPTLFDMLIGNRGGAIGETCAVALILGFVYLVARRIIHWETPVVFVGTVFVLSLIVKQDITAALYQVLGGGLLIGAIFMATDYVTCPINRLGKVVFALGCGIITVLIRFWGAYPEGVSFSILIMNILSPYIEKLCTAKPLGAGGKKNV
ncbi:MAG: RnfABCDGE type electron transport complex subunit D [Clostridia bacterium]|nr:RnfABCDGE type electron transport complex subunit D [Clostridia bacterium]MBR6741967.1 RnfABCDGE type electron transport complex subunit D [Clostridia bacterium]